MGLRIEIDAICKAVLLGFGTGHQAGSIVTADLGRACTVGRSAVVAGYNEIVRLQATFEIGAHRNAENREDELRRRTHTDVVTHTDDERAQVQRTAGTVRRDEAFVGLDYLLAGFNEHIGRDMGHQQAGAAALHALGVLIGTEQIDRAILAAVGLEPLEALLTIMQRGRPFADMQRVVLGQ